MAEKQDIEFNKNEDRNKTQAASVKSQVIKFAFPRALRASA
jgi:hypothetical protein